MLLLILISSVANLFAFSGILQNSVEFPGMMPIKLSNDAVLIHATQSPIFSSYDAILIAIYWIVIIRRGKGGRRGWNGGKSFIGERSEGFEFYIDDVIFLWWFVLDFVFDIQKLMKLKNEKLWSSLVPSYCSPLLEFRQRIEWMEWLEYGEWVEKLKRQNSIPHDDNNFLFFSLSAI